MAVSTTSVGVMTLATVMAGQWSKGTLIPIRVIIGGTVYILFLSFMNEGNTKLARNFAILVLISALFLYAIPIFQGLGLLEGGNNRTTTKTRKPRNGPGKPV